LGCRSCVIRRSRTIEQELQKRMKRLASGIESLV
jgi:hypothetical protein